MADEKTPNQSSTARWGCLALIAVLLASPLLCGGVIFGANAPCAAVVEGIQACDPQPMPTPVAWWVRATCSPSVHHCGALPTSTPTECGAFMGCLYGD